MKLRPEFEVVRAALLNRHPLPSLDVYVLANCFGKNNVFSLKQLCPVTLLFRKLLLLPILPRIKAKVVIHDRFNVIRASNLVILLTIAPRSFATIVSSVAISSRTVPLDHHGVRCNLFMQLIL